jgi:hypothetical protein
MKRQALAKRRERCETLIDERSVDPPRERHAPVATTRKKNVSKDTLAPAVRPQYSPYLQANPLNCRSVALLFFARRRFGGDSHK